MAVIRRTLREYRFMDKDPIKDEMQTALADAGFKTKKDMEHLAVLANVSKQTLLNLFWGDTKRPQNATVEGTLRAAGLERQIVQVRKIKDLDAELEVARAFNRKEAKRVERANARADSGKKQRPGKRRVKKGAPNLRVVGGRAA
jgi:hypothetical protein